ncbi:MAG: hypothetical protein HOJ35_02520 [Bdellovibrionales bacterium]|jgi:hypothetical protein|nr:hypothetical protein [Bdellovibrionales bacterium]
MKLNFYLVLISLFICSYAYSYGVGYSSLPMLPNKKIIATELTSIVSSGGGVGVQARYIQALKDDSSIDIGLGIAGGENSSRVFVGYDKEIFPDYGNQPKVSVKASWENTNSGDHRVNTFSISPIASKGMSFWGKEGYPFVSVPLGVTLDGSDNTYLTSLSLTTGVTGRLPIEGYDHITANIEANIDLKNSWSGLFVGFSYPIN